MNLTFLSLVTENSLKWLLIDNKKQDILLSIWNMLTLCTQRAVSSDINRVKIVSRIRFTT